MHLQHWLYQTKVRKINHRMELLVQVFVDKKLYTYIFGFKEKAK
jgi:hypothetical protein